MDPSCMGFELVIEWTNALAEENRPHTLRSNQFNGVKDGHTPEKH
jgi:hypothetical protein